MGMRNVSRDELAATLRWAAELVDDGDTPSGQITFQRAADGQSGEYEVDGIVFHGRALRLQKHLGEQA